VNEIRFTLDDSDGVLRFAEFYLMDGIVPRHLQRELESYFVGRALSSVRVLDLKAMLVGVDHETLARLIHVMRDYQRLFGGSTGRYASDTGSPCPGEPPTQHRTNSDINGLSDNI
jgi:hypothetical protein